MFPLNSCQNDSALPLIFLECMIKMFPTSRDILISELSKILPRHQQLSLSHRVKKPQLCKNKRTLVVNDFINFYSLIRHHLGRFSLEKKVIAATEVKSPLVISVFAQDSFETIFDRVQRRRIQGTSSLLYNHKLISPKIASVKDKIQPVTDSVDDKSVGADSDCREMDAFLYVLDNDFTRSSEGYRKQYFEGDIDAEDKCCDLMNCSSDDDESDDDGTSFVISRYFKSFGPNSNKSDEICAKEKGDQSSIANDGGMTTFWGDVFDDIPDSETLGSKHQSEELGFDNPCFDDLKESFSAQKQCSYIKMINSNWNISMKGVSEEPRQPRKVLFQEDPDLVTVRLFVPDDDGYKYSEHHLNQIRFRNRIREFGSSMAQFMTSSHRENVSTSRNLFNRL